MDNEKYFIALRFFPDCEYITPTLQFGIGSPVDENDVIEIKINGEQIANFSLKYKLDKFIDSISLTDKK